MAYGTMSIGGLGMKTNDDFIFDQDGTMKINKLTYYPVGSIYQSIDPTSPAELFGGTWESIASNRVLMGASSKYPADSTIEAGLPDITGNFSFVGASDNTYLRCEYANGAFRPFGNSTASATTQYAHASGTTAFVNMMASLSSSIYGNSSTVQPSSYFVYIWKRIE